MTNTALVSALALGIFLVAPAQAQTRAALPVHRFEAAGGGDFIGGASLGTADADLRANNNGATVPFTLFTTSTRLEGAPAVEGRFGYSLTRTISVEASVIFGRPQLRTDVSADFEGAPNAELRERIDQYAFMGSVVLALDGMRLGDRTIPFISGGAGYLRQLHEGRTLIEHGQVFTVGGGVKHWFTRNRSGGLGGTGIRADVRAWITTNAAGSDEGGATAMPAVSGSIFFVF